LPKLGRRGESNVQSAMQSPQRAENFGKIESPPNKHERQWDGGGTSKKLFIKKTKGRYREKKKTKEEYEKMEEDGARETETRHNATEHQPNNTQSPSWEDCGVAS